VAIRFYLSDFVDRGPPLGFCPAVSLVARNWAIVDGRVNPVLAAGRCMVEADVTPAQHTSIIADARNTYLPFEDATGRVLLPGEPLSAISAANRTLIRSRMEAQHVPDDGIQGTDTVRSLVRRIARRFLLRQLLGADDLTEGLDTLISAIPALRRQAIRTNLLAGGVDFDTVVGTDTIRQAIRKLVQQNAPILGALS
jgi:hypothetical protein